MKTKEERMAEVVQQWGGQEGDPCYIGYFACFNQGRYFEAHDVLEQLWLKDRHGIKGDFYKGLIQLAGAFVHLQKHRLGPADALFKLAETNLKKYPVGLDRLDLAQLLQRITQWRQALSRGDDLNHPITDGPPQIILLTAAGQ